MHHHQHGLCALCSNGLTCTYEKNPGRPLLECEEFEAFSMSPASSIRNPFLPRPWRRLESEPIRVQDVRLCGTCRIRAACRIPEEERGSPGCLGYR